MKYILLLIPLLFLSACNGICDRNDTTSPTACNRADAPTRPQETKSAGRMISGTPVRIMQGGANLTVENQASATPDPAGTMVVLSMQLTQQSANDARIMADRTATQQAAANELARATLTAAGPERTERAADNAMQGKRIAVNAALIIMRATQTAEYPDAVRRAAKAQADAQFAPLLSFSGAVAGIITPLAILLSIGLMGWAMVRPHVIAAPVDDDELDEEPEPTPAPSDEWDDLPPGVEESDMRVFMQYATTGKPLGGESMAPVWGTSPAQRAKRHKIMAHLAKHDHIERYAGAIRLTGSADIIWRVWLKNIPPTANNTAINP